MNSDVIIACSDGSVQTDVSILSGLVQWLQSIQTQQGPVNTSVTGATQAEVACVLGFARKVSIGLLTCKLCSAVFESKKWLKKHQAKCKIKVTSHSSLYTPCHSWLLCA